MQLDTNSKLNVKNVQLRWLCEFIRQKVKPLTSCFRSEMPHVCIIQTVIFKLRALDIYGYTVRYIHILIQGKKNWAVSVK